MINKRLEKRNRNRAAASRWQEPSTLIAAVAAVISLVAVYFTWYQMQRPSDLAIEAVRSYAPDDLNRAGEIEAADGRPPGPRIDIVLRNSGNGEGLIDQIKLRVLKTASLNICSKVGGLVVSSATYDFVVKEEAPPEYEVVRESAPFAVQDGRLDQLTISVDMSSFDDPAVAVVEVVLHDSAEEELSTGPVAITGNGVVGELIGTDDGGENWEFKDDGPDGPECMRRNKARLAGVMAFPDLKASDQLALVHEELQKYR
ncbi:hypothetical protein MOQ72_14335 [Saccharopolyspora sp. K220]|uniref:hypothetical protein n=1 Tax=Saccharopolyspora soli TaxID=2926618 RepID=UPI001F595144|nr:hypothetical protein [Saccharopolyspora soli]MCI2418615.1 hypothetical protein [Saccharopolyspora soli]